jgi:uncharacterized membrane protein YphA (DoxX/SURF4 family)
MEVALVVEWLARLAAGGVLVVAALAKWRMGRAPFTRAILGYQLLPARVAAPLARAVPVLELALGAALVAGVFVRPAAVAAAGLLLLFSAAIALALARGQKNACGCGLGRSRAVSRRLLVRNGVLVFVLLATYVVGV